VTNWVKAPLSSAMDWSQLGNQSRLFGAGETSDVSITSALLPVCLRASAIRVMSGQPWVRLYCKPRNPR
jgi:hypothetical protein